jgi:hypothetical protein
MSSIFDEKFSKPKTFWRSSQNYFVLAILLLIRMYIYS